MPERLSDLVPDQPSGSDHALLKAALTLYDTWPIKTDQELEKHVLKILVGIFKALKLADGIDEMFSDDFLNLVRAVIKTILEENEFCWKVAPDIIKVKYLNAAAKLDPARLKVATEKLTKLFTILFRDFFHSTLFLLKEDETTSGDPDYFIDHTREPEQLISNVYTVFLHLKHNDQPLFPQLYRQITDNVLLANGYTEETYKPGKKLKGSAREHRPMTWLAGFRLSVSGR